MDDVFSNFTVVITIGNQTLTLNLHRDEAIVYLAPGNYTVSITVYYTVKPNPHGPPNVVNKPLITIKPAGELSMKRQAITAQMPRVTRKKIS